MIKLSYWSLFIVETLSQENTLHSKKCRPNFILRENACLIIKNVNPGQFKSIQVLNFVLFFYLTWSSFKYTWEREGPPFSRIELSEIAFFNRHDNISLHFKFSG